ncbi:hypothetical protein K458DRAFT_271959, partial [Lentithecium fluviatile CBS 122367]
IVAVITGHIDIETSMLQDGFSPMDQCLYLRSPSKMVCRLGDENAVGRLLRAGAKVPTMVDDIPPSIWVVISGKINCRTVVKLLLESETNNEYSNLHMNFAAVRAAMYGSPSSREAMRLILDKYPSAGNDPRVCARAARNGWNEIFEQIMRQGGYW